MISWAVISSSTKPGPLVKVAGAAVEGVDVVVMAAEVAVAEAEVVEVVAVAAEAEAGTAAIAVAVVAATVAGSRLQQE
jgi:hypothetical protein